MNKNKIIKLTEGMIIEEGDYIESKNESFSDIFKATTYGFLRDNRRRVLRKAQMRFEDRGFPVIYRKKLSAGKD